MASNIPGNTPEHDAGGDGMPKAPMDTAFGTAAMDDEATYDGRTDGAPDSEQPAPATDRDAKGRAMLSGAAQTVKDEAGKLTTSGLDKARAYAVDGKERAGGALDEFARMMTDAAGTVDDKLGAQYGDYARSAATSLSGFADTLRNKDVDELLGDARELVKKSPAVAIGTAAAIGFVLARLVKSGLDATDHTDRPA